jgi:hypothetical protein
MKKGKTCNTRTQIWFPKGGGGYGNVCWPGSMCARKQLGAYLCRSCHLMQTYERGGEREGGYVTSVPEQVGNPRNKKKARNERKRSKATKITNFWVMTPAIPTIRRHIVFTISADKTSDKPGTSEIFPWLLTRYYRRCRPYTDVPRTFSTGGDLEGPERRADH